MRALAPLVAALLALSTATPALAEVEPMLQTTWGQGGDYQRATPLRGGEHTYPGCTTIATAQVLYHYRYQDHAVSDVSYVLDHDGLSGPDIDGNVLTVDLTATSYDFDAMALDLSGASTAEIDATATFIYHVGVTLNAQFGGGEGSSASGRQIENAFRYQWGFDNKPRRQMTIISKDAFGYSDVAWRDLIHSELDAGRPVLYMALQADDDAGHAFVIDGYRDSDGWVHVNWGWGGYGNGYYDANSLTDPSGRSWSRGAMIYLGLEPELGYAAAMQPAPSEPGVPDYTWNGNGSVISAASGTATGYGLTEDEAMTHANSARPPVVFFQWEVDAADGTRLRLAAENTDVATVTYGPWNDRTRDRTYVDVALPFVLDPAADGFDVAAEPYYVLAVTYPQIPSADGVVSAKATTTTASTATSVAPRPFTVGGHSWSGTGSLIANASGTRTGYGLTLDEALLWSQAPATPVVFFQWEIDTADGTRLEITSDGATTATLRYGEWASRDDDVIRTVTLPYVLDPATDGRSAADGTYYTLQLVLPETPGTDTTVNAAIVR